MDIKTQRDERLVKIRDLIRQRSLFGYIVPSWDEHRSGECAADAKRLEYITGFSGSSGIAIITQDQILLITDGRYFTQGAIELSDIKHLILDQSKNDYQKYFPPHALIGYDSRLFTKHQLNFFNALNLVSVVENLVDAVWIDKPKKSQSKIFAYLELYSGKHPAEKIEICTNFIKLHNADYLLITDSITVNWILNIRGSDLNYTPICFSFAIVDRRKLSLFVRNSDDVRNFKELANLIQVLDYEYFEPFLASLDPSKIIVETKSCSLYLLNLLSKDHEIIEAPNPCTMAKACKNDVEIASTKTIHILDAVALCEAFADLTDLYSRVSNFLNEHDVAQLLIKHRKSNKNYLCDSFASICGMNANGAVVHYRPSPNNSKPLSDGIILIDSGGHYLGATTDVTRNLVLGNEVTQEQKTRYTQVLKGHIALALAHFPKGTAGKHLDVLGRQFLRLNGHDYAHGTGHGVGNCLSVHEGPQNISHLGCVPLEIGMVISNEPGYYKEGEYGIRIENLCYVKQSDLREDFLCLEQLTLVPYCSVLIEFSMLSLDERKFIRRYYERISASVMPLLSIKAKSWCLKEINFVLEKI
jgi:Xaa-Pro aminopeptidase